MGKNKNQRGPRQRQGVGMGDTVTHIYDKSMRATVVEMEGPIEVGKFKFTGRSMQIEDEQGNRTWCAPDELVLVN